MTASESAGGPSSADTASTSAAAQLKASRATMKSAMAPAPPTAAPAGLCLAGDRSRSPSPLMDSIADGVDQWWQKIAVVRAAKLIRPVAEPYLKPLVRRNHRALLVASAAVGALVSLAPWRTARVVFKIARPLLFSGLILEVAKAGFRQAAGKPRLPRAADDTAPPVSS